MEVGDGLWGELVRSRSGCLLGLDSGPYLVVAHNSLLYHRVDLGILLLCRHFARR